MAIEQPGILAFVNEHVDAALEPQDADAREVDVDDVHVVYRNVLVHDAGAVARGLVGDGRAPARDARLTAPSCG